MHLKNGVHIDFNKDVPFVEFEILKQIPFLTHAFSTKLGGVSEGMFSSMNLAFISGGHEDIQENVLENYKRIAHSIEVDYNSIVISKQLHNTNIKKVTKDDCGKGLYKKRDFDDIDGLITNLPGITLVTIYADCVPIYLVDIRNKAIGLVHSGWRGTVKRISSYAMNEMNKAYGTEPEDIIAVVGPSICRKCYEISEDVAKEFKQTFGNSNYNILEDKGNGKYQCDLWEANRQVLIDARIKYENIYISELCTSCNSDVFFSHRKTNGKRGSLAAFLSIKI